MKSIKWVKFYQTGNAEVVTFFTENNTVQNDGQTHAFTDRADAQARSTDEVFIFWDNQPVGIGSVVA